MHVCTQTQIAPHSEVERPVSDCGVGKHWELITRITCETHCVSTRGRSFCVTSCDTFSNGQVLKVSSQLRWYKSSSPTLQSTATGLCTTYVMTWQLWNRALGRWAYTDIYKCRMWTHDVLWDTTPCWLVNIIKLHEQTQRVLEILTLKMEVLRSFESSLNIYQLTRIFSDTAAGRSNLKSSDRNLINDRTLRLDALLSSQHLVHKLKCTSSEP